MYLNIYQYICVYCKYMFIVNVYIYTYLYVYIYIYITQLLQSFPACGKLSQALIHQR